jgi:hypothetical protein
MYIFAVLARIIHVSADAYKWVVFARGKKRENG